jgi:hypothetical protein
MPIGYIFWGLMIIWLISYFGVGWWGWGGARGPYLTSIFLWFLLFFLGWAVFGFILQGGGHAYGRAVYGSAYSSNQHPEPPRQDRDFGAR